MNITNIEDIDAIISDYVNDLKLWDKYNEVISFFKTCIKNNYKNFYGTKLTNSNMNIEEWLIFKNSVLYNTYEIDPVDFELNVEMRYKFDKHVHIYDYDFEMMLSDEINNHIRELEPLSDEDSWGSIDPADWHRF